jgi:hypothetical protein
MTVFIEQSKTSSTSHEPNALSVDTSNKSNSRLKQILSSPEHKRPNVNATAILGERSKKRRSLHFVRKRNGNRKELQLMTSESFEALQQGSDCGYEIVQLSESDEEVFLGAIDAHYGKQKFVKASDTKHGDNAPAKRACIWQIIYGTCTRNACPHEHAPDKLIDEKKKIAQKLTEELAKIRTDRLHVLQQIDDYSDESSAENALKELQDDDSDVEMPDFLKDVFGDN